MQINLRSHALCFMFISLAVLPGARPACAQGGINHQISLPPGESWCSDDWINTLFNLINTLRAQNGIPALTMDPVGMKDAEIRATQLIDYLAANPPGSPGFNPHQGYDTLAASLGYNIVGENLAWALDPNYIVNSVWQDPLHRAAMLATNANVAGVSCVMTSSEAYWTYEPGYSASAPAPPPSTPPPPPPPTTPVLDSEESAFLTIINNYRAQNGAGALQVSLTLENASLWMSNDMATHNLTGHTDSLGRDTFSRLTAFGYPYTGWWGENVAGGFPDAQSVFNGWLNACDPDASGNCTYAHRNNMLNGNFKAIGIGRTYNASSNYQWYWVTDFGGVLDQPLNPNPNPPPPPASKPTVSSFAANPAIVTVGQSSTLSWNVSGATAITIDNLIGTVAASGSIAVTPQQTTTYTLTATNTAGTTTAQAVVTVNTAPSAPPATPTLVSAAAKSASEVDLVWSAGTGGGPAAGYQIVRNGSVLGTAPGSSLAYADTTVSANTSYTYSVKAYDAAGNYSALSNSIQVTTPAAPPVMTCAGPGVGVFTGCYYNNTDLAGNPVLVRTDNQINFVWGSGSPASSVPPMNFSVRWQGVFNFNQGSYTFRATISDGMRFYIDGVPVKFAWRDQGASLYLMPQTLSQGNHLITLEYYEHTGTATAILSWPSPSAPTGSKPTISSFGANPGAVSVGQSSTLSWSVSGATAITIDNSIGSVSASGSIVVTPQQTTTYTLTATNASGSTTAQAVVTVNTAPSAPPAIPTLVSAVPKSASEVDLVWSAGTGGGPVAGYQIVRNGSVLGSAPASSLAYADTTVSPNTGYSYAVKAYDAAGNYSALSNSIQVTTPAAPPVSTCPGPGVGVFTGCYYSNTDLAGNPVLVRTDNQINFVWGSGSPASAVPAMNFSVRWQGVFSFNQGSYTFNAMISDGMRFYIDGVPVRFAWRDQGASLYLMPQTLSQGNHLITLEYYEHTGTATAMLSWQKN